MSKHIISETTVVKQLLAIGAAVLLLALLMATPAQSAPAWHYFASAVSACSSATNDATARVNWTFRNGDTQTMRVTVVWGSSLTAYTVAPGATLSGNYAAPLPLAAGSIRFDMTWLTGTATDSATRAYGAVATCAPTALALMRFGAGAVPWGNVGYLVLLVVGLIDGLLLYAWAREKIDGR